MPISFEKPCFSKILFFVFLLCPSILLGKTLNSSISLAGKWKYTLGDNLKWKDPNFDDHDWKDVQLPGKCSDIHYPCYVWYRRKIRLEKISNYKDIALFIGSIWYADEVFVNGVKIGGEGRLGPDFVEAKNKPRLYSINPTLLYKARPNLIAIRSYVSYVDSRVNAPMLIDGKDLLEKSLKIPAEYKQAMIEFFVLGGLIIIDLFCMFLALKNKEEREYTYFTLFMFFYTLVWLLDSLWIYNLGLKTTFIQKLITFFTILGPVPVILFVFALLKKNLTPIFKTFICVFLLIAGVHMLFFHPSVYRITSCLWSVTVLFAFGTLLLTITKSLYVSYKPEYPPICFGLLFLFVAHLVKAAHDFIPLDISMPNKIIHIGVLGFIIMAIYALIIRYHKMAQTLRSVTSKVLAAQEEERRRISRELHDTIGQKLVELKLRLQLAIQQFSPLSPIKEHLLSLRDGLNKSVEELRQISSHLRPVFFEQHSSLSDAIRWYGEILDDNKFHVTYFLDSMNLSSEICEHLYRIYQEAMINIIRYSDAKNIKVFLLKSGTKGILRIEDDGKGIDVTSMKTKRKGLGFDTMQERATIIGGHVKIESLPFKGTKIEVVFPCRER